MKFFSKYLNLLYRFQKSYIMDYEDFLTLGYKIIDDIRINVVHCVDQKDLFTLGYQLFRDISIIILFVLKE